MKKLLLSTLLTVCALSATAIDFEYQGIRYAVLDETARTCQVKFGRTITDNVTIPDSVSDGSTYYRVISINAFAFLGCSELTAITIPNSVTKIGNSAFQNCSGLTSVELPNSITRISNHTFSNCAALTSINIPNSVTELGNGAFDACNGLTSIILPNSVISISDNAFSGCI